MNDVAPREFGARHLVIGLTGALVAGVLVIFGIGRVAGYEDMSGVLDGAQYQWLVVCAVGQIVVFTGYAGAMREAISSENGPMIPVSLSLRLVLASFAATQLFAFAGVAGLAINFWAFRRAGLSRESAAVRLIGLSTAVYLVLGVISWLAAAFAALQGSAPPGMTVPWLIGFPIVLLAARWFTDPARVARQSTTNGGWLRRGLATGISAAAWVRRSLAETSRRRLFRWAALYWIGDIASLWAALHAFGAKPPFAALVLAYSTGYLVQSIPLPLIATGGVDAATTFLLNVIGVPLNIALVSVVAHRVFAFWLPVIPGSIFAVLLPRAGRSLTALSQTESETARS
jgi:uncharacterized membrane protein YbhN (UPF0104 family)